MPLGAVLFEDPELRRVGATLCDEAALLLGAGEADRKLLLDAGLLDRLPELLTALPQKRAVVVTNTVVAPLYLARVRATLARGGIDVEAIERNNFV